MFYYGLRPPRGEIERCYTFSRIILGLKMCCCFFESFFTGMSKSDRFDCGLRCVNRVLVGCLDLDELSPVFILDYCSSQCA